MKNSNQVQDSIRQNGRPEKPSLKHDANLQKNTTLYFQIGLIVCLLAAFGLLEMQFKQNIPNYSYEAEPPVVDVDVAMGPVKVYKEPVVHSKPKAVKVQPKFVEKFKIADKHEDDHIAKRVVDVPVTHHSSGEEDPTLPEFVKPTEEDDLVDFPLIEQVPLYPGCEKKANNAAKKKCMSDKITKLVQRKFKGTAIANAYGLQGRQNIYVQFQIDKTGKVTDVKTKARHPELEAEARRVVGEIPLMQPGMQRDKPVSVRYTLPIAFSIE